MVVILAASPPPTIRLQVILFDAFPSAKIIITVWHFFVFSSFEALEDIDPLARALPRM